MLVAITKGKAGRLPVDLVQGASWREVFRTSEDLLTASVFGRLAYFDGPTLWNILRSTVRGDLPDYKVVDLVNVEFWPRWEEQNDAGSLVEPDVFFQFEVGDPSISFDIIIEAKFGIALTQYKEQWLRQWTAYHLNKENQERASQVFLLAIGGLGSKSNISLDSLLSELETDGHNVKAVGANWDRLVDALNDRSKESRNRHEKRLIGDILEALALAGYRHTEELIHLTPLHRNWNPGISKVLRTYDFQGGV